MHRRIVLLHPSISSRSQQHPLPIKQRRTDRNSTLTPPGAGLLQRDLQHRAIPFSLRHPYPFSGGGGTFLPALRASDKPIAIACFRLVTFLPLRPLFNVPFFISRISVSTFLLAEGLYFRVKLFFAAFFAGAFLADVFFVAVFLLDPFFAPTFFVAMILPPHCKRPQHCINVAS